MSRTTNTIAKLPHTEQIVPAVAATCTTAGSTEGKKCGVCNEVLVAQNVIPAFGHTESEAVEENRKEATCTAAGSYDLVVYCSVCDAEISKSTKTLSAKGHTPSAAVEENRKEATCKVAGSYDEVIKCSVCNAEMSRTTKTIAKLPHTEQIIPAVAATCTSAGLTEGKKCSVCNALLAVQTTVPALGHSYSEVWSYNETNHWHECYCGAKKQNDIHVYGEGEVLVAPTETTEGQTKYTCTTCQYSYIKTVGVLSHTHKFADTLSKNETHHWYAATCGHDEVKDKVTHTWDNGTITQNATCVTPGVKTYSCLCGQTKTEEIPTVAHQYTNRCDETCNVCGLAREVTHLWDNGVITKAATCTSSGLRTYTCELGCGKSYTETIAATGHQYDNACDDECNNCYADRVVGDHVYDDFIDVHCNECNYKREARFAYESRYYHTLRYSTHSNDDYGLVPYFEIREQADGTYVTEISSLKAWSFLRFYFNGQLITRNDVSFEGVVASNYDEAANSSSFKLYFDGDGIYDTAQLNTPYGGEQMIRIVFNPNTKTITITTISEETNYFDEVENVRFSSLYLVANNKTTFNLNMEVPYDDYYTVALNSVYSSFVAYDEYGNKVLELSGKTSKQIYLEKGMILTCTAKTSNSSAAVDLTITLSEHYTLYPYDPQEFVDGDALLAQDKSHVTGDVPSAVIRHEKRKGGLYINCNNPEKLNSNQYNQGLTRDDVSNKEVFFTFEHNNYSVKNFYYGYQVKNTGSEDIYITVKNIGLHIDGSGCWLGEKEWIYFYNTNFKIKGYNSYTSSQKANFNAYISFGMNYKSQNYQPITYRVAPGTYIWVMGGTSADAYGNVNVYGTANYKVTSSCSNGAVLFDVLGEGAVGTFYIYQDASKVGYNNNTHYGYTTGTNPVGHDYGEQYKGSDYCHGVVDGYMTFEFNDNHGVSEDIYLPVEYTNKIEAGAATNGTKYAAFNVVNNNVSQWSWYTHINPQNNNSAVGTDMTAYHTVDHNGNPIVIDYLHRDGRGQAANIGNWMIDYMDHYTFVNHGKVDRKVTLNMYHSGVIAVLVRNPDGSLRSDFTPQYAVRLASSSSGAAIEDLFEYTVTIPAGCYVQFVVEYNLLANASGNIQHNVLLHKKGS